MSSISELIVAAVIVVPAVYGDTARLYVPEPLRAMRVLHDRMPALCYGRGMIERLFGGAEKRWETENKMKDNPALASAVGIFLATLIKSWWIRWRSKKAAGKRDGNAGSG